MAENTDQSRIVRFGVFEVDLRSGELRKNGYKIKLQDQPFRVLIILLRHAGDVVTREELRRELWPTDTFVDFDHSLNAAARRSADNPDSSKLCHSMDTASSQQQYRMRFNQKRPPRRRDAGMPQSWRRSS